MEKKKVIGMIVDYCEEHAVFNAMFPAAGFGVVLLEGKIDALPLESQLMVELGACIVAEIAEDGKIISMCCPPMDHLNPGFSYEEAEKWLQQAQKLIEGSTKGEEDGIS